MKNFRLYENQLKSVISEISRSLNCKEKEIGFSKYLENISEKCSDLETYFNFKNDSLNMVGDILKNSEGHDSLFDTALEVISQKSKYYYQNNFLTETSKIFDFYRIYGNFYSRNGNAGGALDLLKRVLKFDPARKEVLNDIRHICANKKCSHEAAQILKTYKLRYIRSIGKGILSLPYYGAYCDENNLLLISDCGKNEMYLFSPEGKFEYAIALDLVNPMGIFPGKNSSFWVCDWGNRSIKEFNLKGDLLSKINLNETCANIEKNKYPIVGIHHQDSLRILVTDEKKIKRSILHFNQNKVSSIASNELNCISDVAIINNELYVCDAYTGHIYQYQPRSNRFLKINIDPLPVAFYQFTLFNGAFFCVVDSGRALIKMSFDGRLIFRENNLARLLNSEPQIIDLFAFKSNDCNLLAATDIKNNCIHIFEI
jgi:hypothetical protein